MADDPKVQAIRDAFKPPPNMSHAGLPEKRAKETVHAFSARASEHADKISKRAKTPAEHVAAFHAHKHAEEAAKAASGISVFAHGIRANNPADARIQKHASQAEHHSKEAGVSAPLEHIPTDKSFRNVANYAADAIKAREAHTATPGDHAALAYAHEAAASAHRGAAMNETGIWRANHERDAAHHEAKAAEHEARAAVAPKISAGESKAMASAKKETASPQEKALEKHEAHLQKTAHGSFARDATKTARAASSKANRAFSVEAHKAAAAEHRIARNEHEDAARNVLKDAKSYKAHMAMAAHHEEQNARHMQAAGGGTERGERFVTARHEAGLASQRADELSKSARTPAEHQAAHAAHEAALDAHNRAAYTAPDDISKSSHLMEVSRHDKARNAHAEKAQASAVATHVNPITGAHEVTAKTPTFAEKVAHVNEARATHLADMKSTANGLSATAREHAQLAAHTRTKEAHTQAAQSHREAAAEHQKVAEAFSMSPAGNEHKFAARRHLEHAAEHEQRAAKAPASESRPLHLQEHTTAQLASNREAIAAYNQSGRMPLAAFKATGEAREKSLAANKLGGAGSHHSEAALAHLDAAHLHSETAQGPHLDYRERPKHEALAKAHKQQAEFHKEAAAGMSKYSAQSHAAATAHANAATEASRKHSLDSKSGATLGKAYAAHQAAAEAHHAAAGHALRAGDTKAFERHQEQHIAHANYAAEAQRNGKGRVGFDKAAGLDTPAHEEATNKAHAAIRAAEGLSKNASPAERAEAHKAASEAAKTAALAHADANKGAGRTATQLFDAAHEHGQKAEQYSKLIYRDSPAAPEAKHDAHAVMAQVGQTHNTAPEAAKSPISVTHNPVTGMPEVKAAAPASASDAARRAHDASVMATKVSQSAERRGFARESQMAVERHEAAIAAHMEARGQHETGSPGRLAHQAVINAHQAAIDAHQAGQHARALELAHAAEGASNKARSGVFAGAQSAPALAPPAEKPHLAIPASETKESLHHRGGAAFNEQAHNAGNQAENAAAAHRISMAAGKETKSVGKSGDTAAAIAAHESASRQHFYEAGRALSSETRAMHEKAMLAHNAAKEALARGDTSAAKEHALVAAGHAFEARQRATGSVTGATASDIAKERAKIERAGAKAEAALTKNPVTGMPEISHSQIGLGLGAPEAIKQHVTPAPPTAKAPAAPPAAPMTPEQMRASYAASHNVKSSFSGTPHPETLQARREHAVGELHAARELLGQAHTQPGYNIFKPTIDVARTATERAEAASALANRTQDPEHHKQAADLQRRAESAQNEAYRAQAPTNPLTQAHAKLANAHGVESRFHETAVSDIAHNAAGFAQMHNPVGAKAPSAAPHATPAEPKAPTSQHTAASVHLGLQAAYGPGKKVLSKEYLLNAMHEKAHLGSERAEAILHHEARAKAHAKYARAGGKHAEAHAAAAEYHRAQSAHHQGHISHMIQTGARGGRYIHLASGKHYLSRTSPLH